MHRRRLLAGVAGLAGMITLSGCSLFESGSAESSTTADGPSRTVEPYTEPVVDRPGGDSDDRLDARERGDCLPRTVHIDNTAAFDQYVTVALDAVDGETSVVESASVPAGETVVHDELAPARGRYRVTVDTADGRVGSGEFVVSEGTSDLAVLSGPKRVRLRQRATGWPDCPLVSTGGEAASSPTLAGAVRRYGLQRVVVDNVGSVTTAVRIRIRAVERSETLLDYGYRLPPGMRLDLPLVPRAASYNLTVSTETDRQQRRWEVEAEPTVAFTVGDGVSSSPGLFEREVLQSLVGSQLHHLRNDDNRPHSLTLTLRRGGRLLTADRYNLAIDDRIGLGLSLPRTERGESDGFELALSTGDGAEASVTWDDCPPAGRVVVAIDDRGLFRVYSTQAGSLTD